MTAAPTDGGPERPGPGGAGGTGPHLVPVVVQHAGTGQVLMLAYASDESLKRTRETGEMHFWSRSRQALWHKGESSGNIQRVVDLQWDCDRDALLARVIPLGPACHTGAGSCFPGPEPPYAILEELRSVVADRARRAPDGSYVAGLLRDLARLRRKVGEEAIELILASEGPDRASISWEAADLLFHMMVLLQARGVSFEEVLQELRRRRPGSGEPAAPDGSSVPPDLAGGSTAPRA